MTLHAIVPLLLLLGTGWLIQQMMAERPRPERKSVEKHTPGVEVVTARAADQPVRLTGMGAVSAAHDVELRAEVAGRLAWLAAGLEPGALVSAEQPLVRIDREAHELAVTLREAEVSQASAAMKEARNGLELARRDRALEEGRSKIAAEEAERFEGELAISDLALRKPQMEAAEAGVSAARARIDAARAALAGARARLDAARLDLARTEVASPVDAVVTARSVDIGELVGPTTPLLRLVATDTFWVEVAVPERDLRWVKLPGAGSEAGGGSGARLRHEAAWGPDRRREGRVLRRMPAVDPAGRMARLLVAVSDPLALSPEHEGQPALLLGSYVAVDIEGRVPDGGVRLARELLRDGDTAWVVGPDDRLAIRQLTLSHRGETHVIVESGLDPGERVVLTPLATPVEGMTVRPREASKARLGAR